MNKYQEALDELYKQRSERYNVFQKHKEWLKEIKEYDKVGDCLHLLQELVDKETPKKPIIRGLSVAIHTCPVCDKELIVTNDEIVIYKTKTNYCDNCGQALDWSDEVEK